MSNYFKDFPKVFYKFGSNEQPVYFQKLTKYSDIVDTIKDKIGAYIEYEILDFDRPDTLSYKLYGKSEYDWTFFLMNDRLRETGWPMPLQHLYDFAVNDAYTGYVAQLNISTLDSASTLASVFTAGKSVIVNGINATVERRDLENKQVYLLADSDITVSTSLTIDSQTISLTNVVNEYNAVHHYINDSDEWIDAFSTDTTKVPVTNLEHLVNENDLSKKIRIIKKQNIESAVSEFKRLVASK